MSRFQGKQDYTGPLKGRRNKGVLAAYRAKKRGEAIFRQGKTDPRRTKAFRLGSIYDPNTGKRRQWNVGDWRRHDEAVACLQDKEMHNAQP